VSVAWEKINKNASVEQLRRKLATVLTERSQKSSGLNDVHGSDFVNFPALQDKAAKAMAGNGTPSVLDGILMGPDLGDMTQRVQATRRAIPQHIDQPCKAGKRGLDNVEDTDDEALSAEEATPMERGSAFLGAVSKASRTYVRSFNKLGKKMQMLLQKIDETVLDFHTETKTGKFQSEFAVMMRRQQWLHTVMNGTPASLAELVVASKAEGQSVVSGESSDNLSKGSGRMAPCAGYEQLMVFEHLEGHRAIIRSAQSQEILTAVCENVEALLRLYEGLCKSCTAAIDDLLSARTAEAQKNRVDEVKAEKRKNFENASMPPRNPATPCLQFWISNSGQQPD